MRRYQHSTEPLPAGLCRALFLTTLLTTILAKRLENGLEIETTRPGDCAHEAQNGDKIFMHYKGTLSDGTVFDSSLERDEPLDFKLGAGEVIDGWDLGLLETCLGEERKLVIPPKVSPSCHVLFS